MGAKRRTPKDSLHTHPKEVMGLVWKSSKEEGIWSQPGRTLGDNQTDKAGGAFQEELSAYEKVKKV